MLDDVNLYIETTLLTLFFLYYHNEHIPHYGNSLGFNDIIIKSMFTEKHLIILL